MPSTDRPSDRGSAPVEAVLVFPALLLLLAAALQLALYGLAAHGLELATAEAGAEARAASGGTGPALQLLRRDVATLDGSLLEHPRVTITSSGGVEELTTSATVLSLLPWVHLSVRATTRGPVQSFHPGGA